MKRGNGLGVGNPAPGLRVGKGGKTSEFVAATLRDTLPQALVMIGEEEERRARCPFLSHKQQRRGRRTK